MRLHPPLVHKCLAALLILTLPVLAQAQFTYATNSGGITITGYTGPGGGVIIPTNINGLPVTDIGEEAFSGTYSLTSVSIPQGVTNIDEAAFQFCRNMTAIIIPCSVTNIGDYAFLDCTGLTQVTLPDTLAHLGGDAFLNTGLTNVTIPASVMSIGSSSSSYYYGDVSAFQECHHLLAIVVDPQNQFFSSLNGVLFDKSREILLDHPCGILGSYQIPAGVTDIGLSAFNLNTNLTSITIPGSVTNFGPYAFEGTSNLTSIYFEGNAPTGGEFLRGANTMAYYLPGTLGWGTNYGGISASPWFLPYPTILNNGPGFGVKSNAFGFTISWATNVPVVVEAATNLANPIWVPIATNALTIGSCFFSDPQWTDYSSRFYRVGTP